MTQLNSKFDVVSRDPHPNARAGLMVILDVDGALGPYAPGGPGSGTPIPGNIQAGSIVVMKTNGKAILADNVDALTNAPQMFYVTVDGDRDFDGAFVHSLTCIQGGMEIVTDLFEPGLGYLPGVMLTCADSTGLINYSGYFRPALVTEQIYGMVGSMGYDSIENTLHVIIPQGISPAA
jgi:hypothetical protein